MPEEQIQKTIDIKFLEQPNNITIKVIDVPRIHYCKNFEGRDNVNKIFDALYNARNNEAFNSESIKALIEVRWHRLLPRVISFELLPYLMYVIVFYIYTIYDCQSYESIIQDPTKAYMGHVLGIMLGILLTYFSFLEGLQIYKQRLNYFLSIWNWFDMANIVLVITGEIMQVHSRHYYSNN